MNISITPIKQFNATLFVPGSKYVANRILMIAALANGESHIRNLPRNNDITAAINAIKGFGIKVHEQDNCLVIIGNNGKLSPVQEQIDVSESGTLMRFATAMAALSDKPVEITGSQRILERPVIELVEALKELGLECEAAENGCPPVKISGGRLFGGKTRVSAVRSSQYISALLQVAPFADMDVAVEIKDELSSKSYVDLTIDLMRQFGVVVDRKGYECFVIRSGQSYQAGDYRVPGDWSSANYFLAAAALTGGTVRLTDISMASLHGEKNLYTVLEKMGCRITVGPSWIEVVGPQKLQAVTVDMASMPDSVQTLAVLAAFAAGTTIITNIGHLKYKESDRLNDTVNELLKLGINANVIDDGLEIQGGLPHGAVINSHNDHRMAMSFSLAGLKVPGIEIYKAEAVAKSYPGYWDKLKSLGVQIESK